MESPFKQQRPEGLLVSQEQFPNFVCCIIKFLITAFLFISSLFRLKQKKI